eukprot:1938802-Pyramimonas_sp.AAC.1
MVRHRHAHSQTVSVLLGHIMHEEPTLAPSGTLSSTANPWIRQFARDLECYSLKELFQDSSDSAHEFLRINARILRCAVFTDRRHWDRLVRFIRVQ